MTGDNGTPETPDWSLTNVVRVDAETWDWIMSDEDDGVPETPDWRPVPRCWPEHGARCDSCDVCTRHEVDGYGVYPLPERIELGEN